MSVVQDRDEVLSSIWTAGLDFGHRDLMLLNLLIKRASRNAETFGRFFYSPSFLLQHALDVLFFEFQKRQSGVEEGRSHLSMPIEMQIVERDVFLVTQ